jgi:DNA repair protein RadC
MVYEAVFTKKLKKRIEVRSPEDIYRLLKKVANSRQEQCVVVTLDNYQIVLGVHVVNIGTANHTAASMKDIFYKAIKDNAISIIFCHNHPGDSIEPSKADLEFADKLYKAGTIMDIPVQDQFIISEYGYTSIKPSVKAMIKGEIKYDI